MDETHVHYITRVIQLALAPAFLLTAVGSLLNVFANRLARIVDRYRAVQDGAPGESADALLDEIRTLERRASMVRWSITLGTGAALLVSLVIGFAFLGFILTVNFARLVAVLFVTAMGALTVALGFFLREVIVAIGSFEALLPSSARRRDRRREEPAKGTGRGD